MRSVRVALAAAVLVAGQASAQTYEDEYKRAVKFASEDVKLLRCLREVATAEQAAAVRKGVLEASDEAHETMKQLVAGPCKAENAWLDQESATGYGRAHELWVDAMVWMDGHPDFYRHRTPWGAIIAPTRLDADGEGTVAGRPFRRSKGETGSARYIIEEVDVRSLSWEAVRPVLAAWMDGIDSESRAVAVWGKYSSTYEVREGNDLETGLVFATDNYAVRMKVLRPYNPDVLELGYMPRAFLRPSLHPRELTDASASGKDWADLRALSGCYGRNTSDFVKRSLAGLVRAPGWDERLASHHLGLDIGPCKAVVGSASDFAVSLANEFALDAAVRQFPDAAGLHRFDGTVVSALLPRQPTPLAPVTRGGQQLRRWVLDTAEWRYMIEETAGPLPNQAASMKLMEDWQNDFWGDPSATSAEQGSPNRVAYSAGSENGLIMQTDRGLARLRLVGKRSDTTMEQYMPRAFIRAVPVGE